ncbi:histamine N-methyltransferase A-like [Glandiceps talaboti]
MVSLLSSHVSYQKSLIAYHSHTNRADRVYQVCSTEIPETVISTLTGDVDQFRYLGVGSGSGTADIKLLIQLTKRYPKIKATIVEPSPLMMSSFKENIIREGSKLEDVEFEWNVMTFEEYMERQPSNQHFHCILAVAVAQYFMDLAGALQHMYKILAKNGTIAFMNEQERNVVRAISEQFPSLSLGYKKTPTENMVAVFNDIGASVRVFEMEAEADVTLCWQEDSEVGNLMLDFFTQVVNFREAAPKDLIEDVLHFLEGPTLLSHKTADGSTVIRNHKDIIIVN